jgi:hypothetical protein
VIDIPGEKPSEFARSDRGKSVPKYMHEVCEGTMTL